MSIINACLREAQFALRQRMLRVCMALVLALSAVAVGFGLAETRQQQQTIAQLIELDQRDRMTQQATQSSWGGAAYYSFHLTWDAPSAFAFAAMGMRDVQPWKHRIRMLALEGQIYERDSGNPAMALIGRFDFAFLAAFIVPLILIVLLYDLKASEQRAGRYELLEASLGHARNFWLLRAVLRGAAVYLCLVLPLCVAAIIGGTAAATVLLACLLLLLYVAFWTLLCLVAASWRKPASVILSTLMALWLGVAVVVPAMSRLAIDHWVSLPASADILLLQRESVNDAWDLPRAATMDAFFARHPEWASYEPSPDGFEWQWYYAFQQVGDQRSEALSNAYLQGRLQRDRMAAWVSVLAPPALLERGLQALAGTDMQSGIAYEQRVRAYHSRLRDFYYPRFFGNRPFVQAELTQLPVFGGAGN